MGRPIRLFEPQRFYFVTNRTIHGRLLMAPSPVINNIIGGILARALDTFDVELFAHSFLSNHFHAILRAGEGEISAFMQFLESNIARKVGQHIGWRDRFWARRFSAEPILDDDALVGRLRYILSHGVKENLVDSAADWPGLTAIPELAHGVRRIFTWHDATAEYRARRRGEDVSPGDFQVRYTFDLSPLPCWQDLKAEARQRRVRQIICDVEQEARDARGSTPVLDVANVLAQDPHEEPEGCKRSRRPLCHASTREAWDAFKTIYRDFIDAYAVASHRFRSGHFDVAFPLYAFRPPVPYGWSPAPA